MRQYPNCTRSWTRTRHCPPYPNKKAHSSNIPRAHSVIMTDVVPPFLDSRTQRAEAEEGPSVSVPRFHCIRAPTFLVFLRFVKNIVLPFFTSPLCSPIIQHKRPGNNIKFRVAKLPPRKQNIFKKILVGLYDCWHSRTQSRKE